MEPTFKFVRSKRFAPLTPCYPCNPDPVVFPDLSASLASIEAINLSQILVNHNGSVICSLGFKMSDGQACKVGSRDFNDSVAMSKLDPVCKIEVHYAPNDSWITYLVVVKKSQRVVLGGKYYKDKGRKEEFIIEADEKLIGAEIEHNDVFVFGITFITLKKLN